MQKLDPKTIKIHAKIITPIHIDNGEVLDRMDYFLLSNEWNLLQSVNKKWLVDCAKKDKELFTKIIKSIENGNFNELEKLKKSYYNKDIGSFILDEIKVGDKAKESLLNLGNSNNQGFIKRFSRFGLDKELFIPGSTLKGIFRTIFLFDEIEQGKNYKSEAFRIESLEKDDKFKKELFAFLQFEDVNINNLGENLEIQEISSKNKPPKKGQLPKPGINQILEILNQGEFEIDLLDLKGQLDLKDLNKKIKNYSSILVAREEQILNNIGFRSDFIDKLDENYKDGYFPIKIGMFKKSLSYKLFWEEMIEELNKIVGKEWLREAQKKGIGDKMIYLDEQQNPIGWIAVKILGN